MNEREEDHEHLSDAAAGEHLARHAPDPAHPHDDDAEVADLLRRHMSNFRHAENAHAFGAVIAASQPLPHAGQWTSSKPAIPGGIHRHTPAREHAARGRWCVRERVAQEPRKACRWRRGDSEGAMRQSADGVHLVVLYDAHRLERHEPAAQHAVSAENALAEKS